MTSFIEIPRLSRATAALLVAALPSAALAAGEAITVTTLHDTFDIAMPQQVGDLPGPDGEVSFREALAAANNTPGPQTIKFAIPQSEWWLYSDRAILEQENGTFVVNDNETTIDFTSQTTFTGDTNPDGWEVGVYGLEPNAWGVTAISVNADNCVIKGLDRVMQRGYGVQLAGNNNRVISCSISGPLYAGVKVQGQVGDPAVGNTIGGTAPGEGNVLSGGNAGVRIDGPADGTIVIGNTLVGSPFAGVEVRGAYCCPDYTPYNTRIGGPTPEERNWIANNGKYGEEGFPLGDQVTVEWAVNTTVEGNFIGTTEAGDARYPGARGTAGISVRESDTTIILNNLISGIRKEGVNHYAGQVFGSGISVLGPNTGIDIKGNLVGTDATGQNPVPNLVGISFSWFQGYAAGGQIGGTSAGDGNTVAFNERSGIVLASGINGVTIERNSIHSNGALGIDLLNASGASGVSPNDPGDGDVGANGLQNFPVIDMAMASPTTIDIQGALNSRPNRTYTVDFYANVDCDSSGNGEGERYIGSTDVTTDGSGDAIIDVTLSASVPQGDVVTATATDTSTGDTSEFSLCLAVGATSVSGDVDSNGVVDVFDLFQVLSAWGSCSNCAEDITGDGAVDVFDLFEVLSNWG